MLKSAAVIALFFALSCTRLICAPDLSAIDARKQERVAELILEATGPHRTGPWLTNTAWNNSLRVEAIFREASQLMPERIDLRLGIASALVGQAAQTNSSLLRSKITAALDVYHEIWMLDTNGFLAPILYAACARVIGETDRYHQAIQQLATLYPERTREFVDRFDRADSFLTITPNDQAPKKIASNNQHAIVVFGAALETNGLAKPKLIGRLRPALTLARRDPAAPILLTGGNQKNGVTEAFVMRAWLRQRGISEKRIHLEDLARDTVGNALNSAAILQKLRVTDVTVVTSSTHIRRGLADLNEACLQRGLALHFANLAPSTGEPALDPLVERLSTYRDVLRIAGFWSYPSFQ